MSATWFNLTVVGIGFVALAAFLYFGGFGVARDFFADDSSSSRQVVVLLSPTPEPTPTTTPMSTLESSDEDQLSRLLFFSDYSPNGPSLYMVTADASNLTLIDTVEESGATPSPDGEKIVVDCRPSENRASKTTDLCLSTNEGLEVRIETGKRQAMAWAPDSRWLAFITDFRDDEGVRVGSELYLLDATDGSIRSLITGVPGAIFHKPRWSPDSRRVAIVVDYLLSYWPAQRRDLEVVNVQEGGRISLGGASEFAWAPDSSALAFVRGGELYSVAFDGSNLRQLTDGGESGFDVWPGAPPVWSPDGRWLAVTAANEATGGLFVVPASGGPGRLLASDIQSFRPPVWSPDSDRLAFVAAEEASDPVCGRGSALYVTDLENGTPKELTMSRPFTFFPLVTWSPDGDRLFYTAWSGLQGDDPASWAHLLPCIEGGPESFLFSVTADDSGSPVQLTDFGVRRFLGWQPQTEPATPEELACAAGSTQRFRDVVAAAPWPVYCPTFLPDGYELEDIVYGRDLLGAEREGAMQAQFVNMETGGHVTFIQGLPGLSALTSGIRGQEVLHNIPYGDLEARLFRSSPDYPRAPFLAVIASFGEITHWIEASGPTEDETREIAAEMRPATTLYWATYRNDELGYEFEYPKFCGIHYNASFPPPFSRIRFNIVDSEGLSLSEYSSRFIEGLNESYTIESTQSGSVSGKESITISYRGRVQREFGSDTLVDRDGLIYIIGFDAKSLTCGEPAIYSRILSTLRFIE